MNFSFNHIISRKMIFPVSSVLIAVNLASCCMVIIKIWSEKSKNKQRYFYLKGWNLRDLGSWTITISHLMFLSREIDTKLCHNYTKKYICKIYVRITWPELPPMAVQYTGHVIQTETCDNNTALPLDGVLVTWSGSINNIINYIY